MMTQEEIMNKFDELYDIMSSSGKVEYMQLFGDTMRDMMEWYADNKPEAAQQFLERLCAVKWKNYLTKSEAVEIVQGMKPKAPWSIEQWREAMNKMGIPIEESPFYNSYALYVAMNMVYSDSAKTIAKLLGKSVEEVTGEQMVKATYSFAIDKLKDEDGVFDIRRYFDL